MVRSPRSFGEQRLQIRWLTLAVTLVASMFVVYGVLVAMQGTTTPSGQGLEVLEYATVVSFLAVPISIAFGVLKYRLYDIDVIINKAVVVSAQEERARRLERNIHDGAQQQLVALRVKLRLAQGLVEKDPVETAAMLGELQVETQATLEDLRDLARGIYPPLLADEDLRDALEAQARKSVLPVCVDTDGIGRYPQDVEAALYFCTLEALQNISKYARASSISVRLAERGGRSPSRSSTTASGSTPSTPAGAGLANMRDRLEALGGSLTMTSSPGSGTIVEGQVRVGPEG